MNINIPEKFLITAEQETALIAEGKRIETEIGARRVDFEVLGVSGYAVGGTMEVTSAPLKANEHTPFEEVKAEKPKAAKEPEAETVTAEGKAPVAAAKSKKK